MINLTNKWIYFHEEKSNTATLQFAKVVKVINDEILIIQINLSSIYRILDKSRIQIRHVSDEDEISKIYLESSNK